MHHRSLYSALITASAAIAIVAMLPGRARADKAPRVGIVVSVLVNLKKSEAQQLSDAFGRALNQKLVVNVVAGSEASRRLPVEGVPESCVVDQVCLRDIAQRLTADELLFLVAVRVGNRIQVDSTWVDPSNGRTASRPKVVMVKLEEAEQRVSDAASLILPDAPVRQAQPADVGPGSGGGGTDGAGSPAAIIIRTTPRSMSIPAWITAGVGVVALGGAVAYTLGAKHDHDLCQEAYDDPDIPNCNQEFLDQVDKKALRADVLWGATALAAVAVGVLYWTSGGEIERVPVAAQALRFRVGPGGSAFVFVEGHL